MADTLNPFAGYPATSQSQSKSGQKRYVVFLKATGPITANIRDKATILLTATSAIALLLVAASADQAPTLIRLALCAAPLLSFFVSRSSFEWLLARRKTVVFTPERISVRGMILARDYDRSLDIRFTIRKHERAERQNKIIEHRRTKPDGYRGWWPEKNYYESSYRLSIDVLSQAFPITTIYGQARATRICARLNAIHNSLGHGEGRGSSIALSASDDWALEAGDLS